MILRYRDLSIEEKKLITNGCGGKGGFVKPPQFFFKASCNQHDFYYWRGGDWLDRFHADWEFYKAMILDIRENVKNYKLKTRFYYFIIATIYFLAVRIFGSNFFSYSKKLKTRKNLDFLIKDKNYSLNLK